MAYLNVRDRRIEATIAYVGPELAGKKTNFERLGRRDRNDGTVTFDDDGITLEWCPAQRDRFEDCDLRVKLVAPESGLDTARLDDVLARADGVVVVVEATAESRSETLRALHLVREAIERKDAGSPLPVVVQLNKNDRADAAVVEEVAQMTDWPVVRASAVHGEGVMETLESALDNVIHAMKQAPTPTAVSSPLDKHPLLSALRGALRETVTEHVTTLERVIAARTETVLAARFDALERTLTARHDQTIEAITSTSERIEALERGMVDVRNTLRDVTRRTADLGGECSKQASAVAEISTQIAAFRASTKEPASAEDVSAIEARMREELTAQSRSDREHLTSVAAVLRRSVEAVAVELRSSALTEKHAAVATEMSNLRAKTDAMSGAVDAVVAKIAVLPPSIAALESSVHREIRTQLERLLNAVTSAQTETGDTIQRTERRADEIKGHLDELIEELKRRKKGWFG